MTDPGSAATVEMPVELLTALVDTEDCWLDHHGGCQAHGYLSLQGQECPQHELKRRLSAATGGPA